MEKAMLCCPRQKVFFKGFLTERNALPTEEHLSCKKNKLNVKVLEIIGEKALVLLPKWFAKGKKETVIVDVGYLE